MNKEKKIKLQIILPAYNEQAQIPEAVHKFYNEFKSLGDQVQLILVLNGCDDNSLTVAEEIKINYPGFLKILNFNQKIGKGGAVLEGLKVAQADYICFADVDCAVPPSEVYKLYQNIGKYDCIIGSRHLQNSKILIQQPLRRRVAGKTFNLFCRALFGFSYKDTQCGGKVFKRSTVDCILKNVKNTGWAFDVEILVILYNHGFAIKEFPINWYHDDNSKIKLLSDGFKMFLSVIKTKFYAKRIFFEKTLFLQHHYIFQGTFIRAIGFAKEMATRQSHIYVTCINDRIAFLPKISTYDENPYVTLIKLPRFFIKNSFFDIFLRLPFAIWVAIKNKYKILYVFAMGMPTNSLPAFLYRFIRGKNIIIDWDDLWHNGYGKYTGRVGNFLFKIFERYLTRLIKPAYATCVSSFLKEEFIKLGLKEENVFIIGNGSEQTTPLLNDQETLREKYQINKDTKIVLSVGNTYGKSFLNLIEAFKLASNEDPNIKLFLLGQFLKGGSIGKEIEEIIKKNRELFLSKIQVLGHLAYNDYYNYLKIADCAILPMENTNIDKARFPIRFSDYIRFQLPIVSNATGVIKEVLDKYHYGYVCDVDDLKTFSKLIIKASNLDDKYYQKEIAIKILNNELNWQINANILNHLFNKVKFYEK